MAECEARGHEYFKWKKQGVLSYRTDQDNEVNKKIFISLGN